MKKLSAAELHAWQSTQPLGAAWGNETDRAAVLAFDPEGKNKRIFATGIRNCVGMAVAPASGELWCSTNERDGLGDDVPTDYVTHVREARLLEPFQTHRLQGHSRHTETAAESGNRDGAQCAR